MQTGTKILVGMEQGALDAFWTLAAIGAFVPLFVGFGIVLLLWKRTPRNDLFEQHMRDVADANVRKLKTAWPVEKKREAA